MRTVCLYVAQPSIIRAGQVTTLLLNYKSRQLFYFKFTHVNHLLLFCKSMLLSAVELEKKRIGWKNIWKKTKHGEEEYSVEAQLV